MFYCTVEFNLWYYKHKNRTNCTLAIATVKLVQAAAMIYFSQTARWPDQQIQVASHDFNVTQTQITFFTQYTVVCLKKCYGAVIEDDVIGSSVLHYGGHYGPLSVRSSAVEDGPAVLPTTAAPDAELLIK